MNIAVTIITAAPPGGLLTPRGQDRVHVDVEGVKGCDLPSMIEKLVSDATAAAATAWSASHPQLNVDALIAEQYRLGEPVAVEPKLAVDTAAQRTICLAVTNRVDHPAHNWVHGGDGWRFCPGWQNIDPNAPGAALAEADEELRAGGTIPADHPMYDDVPEEAKDTWGEPEPGTTSE